MATTTAETLRAFHGEPAIKARYLARLEEHHELGHLKKFGGLSASRLKDGAPPGGAVQCTVHSKDYASYEKQLGIPRILARLEDGIFNSVSTDAAPRFAVDFLEAVPVGANLSCVAPRFLHWLLMDEEDGIIHIVSTEMVAAAIRGVEELLSRSLAGEIVAAKHWRKAGNATIVAADAAFDADIFCDVNAAFSAASMAIAPLDAAAAASRAAAAAASHSLGGGVHAIASMKQAAKLLQLLREAPVTI